MATPRESGAVLPNGTLFSQRYELVRCIKIGGMGILYEAVHLETRRRRALKVMFPESVPNPELRGRFKLEASVVADIDSEHIVETVDAGIDSATGAPFIVMELLKGEDLGELLDRRGRLPAREVVELLDQVALALDKTHRAGIVHRDLKPENLFLTRHDNGAPRVKILDFGIAKVVGENAHAAKATRSLGTPLYMSPEQIEGRADIGPAADLYALGHIAFTLVVGRAYWSDELERLAVYPFLRQVVTGATEPARLRARRYGGLLSMDFDEWFTKATAVVPEQRFASASDLLDGLAAALEITRSRPAPTDSAEPDDEPTKAWRLHSTEARLPRVASTTTTDDGLSSGPIARLPQPTPVRERRGLIAGATAAAAVVAVIAIAALRSGEGGAAAGGEATSAPAAPPTQPTTSVDTEVAPEVTPVEAPSASDVARPEAAAQKGKRSAPKATSSGAATASGRAPPLPIDTSFPWPQRPIDKQLPW